MSTQESDEKFCFVIMSFSGNDDRNTFYYGAIKPTVERFQYQCANVAEQEFNSSIKNKITDNIKNADFIIADLSENRPNCYYELGIAHALNKEVIHLFHKTNKPEDKPHFDINDFNIIFYENVKTLQDDLKRRIETTIQKLKKNLLWLIPNKNQNTNVEQSVLSAYANLQVSQYYLEESSSDQLEVGDTDIVLYSYQKTEKSSLHCENIITSLKTQKKNIPLIIFTPDRIEGVDYTTLQSYSNYRLANMLATLKQNLNL